MVMDLQIISCCRQKCFYNMIPWTQRARLIFVLVFFIETKRYKPQNDICLSLNYKIVIDTFWILKYFSRFLDMSSWKTLYSLKVCIARQLRNIYWPIGNSKSSRKTNNSWMFDENIQTYQKYVKAWSTWITNLF